MARRRVGKALPVFDAAATISARVSPAAFFYKINAEVTMKFDRNKMTMPITMLAIATLSTALVMPMGPSPLRAQAVDLVIVDLKVVEQGYRAHKLVGRTVVNDLNETIGTIDDVIVTKDHDVYMPVQVGGFLGVGSRLVVLPFDAFGIDDRKIVLPNASKEQLKKLAVFKYVG
jgi:PRC-barrel domain